MGGSQSQPFMNELLAYRVIEKCPQNNMTYLSRIESNEQFLLLEHTYNYEGLYKKCLETHKLRGFIKQNCLTHLSWVQGRQIDHLCSSLYKIYALWEYPYRTLHTQISYRCSKNRIFEDKQLWSILASAILALSTLQKNKIKHEMITTKAILLDNQGLVKVTDPLTRGTVTNMELVYRNRNAQGIYLSPQQCQELQQSGVYSNPFKNDVWTLGMILLECGLLKNQSDCYKQDYQKIDYEKIDKNLQQFSNRYGKQLQQILSLMIKKQNNLRPDWIILQQYVNKTIQNCHLVTSPKQQSNLSSFTPTSNKLALSPYSPDAQIICKPIEYNRICQNVTVIKKQCNYNSNKPLSNSTFNQPIKFYNVPHIHSNSSQQFASRPTPTNQHMLYHPNTSRNATPPISTVINSNYIPKTNFINSNYSVQLVNQPNTGYQSSRTTSNNCAVTTIKKNIQYQNPTVGPTGKQVIVLTHRPNSTDGSKKYQAWKNSLTQRNYLKNNKIGISQTYSTVQTQPLRNEYQKNNSTKLDDKNYLSSPKKINQSNSQQKNQISKQSNLFQKTNNNNDHININRQSNSHNNPLNLFYNSSSSTYTTNNNMINPKNKQINKIYNSFISNTLNSDNSTQLKNDKSTSVPKQTLSNFQPTRNKKTEEQPNQPKNKCRAVTEIQQKNTYIDLNQPESANMQNSFDGKQQPQYVIQTFKQGSRYEGFKFKDLRHGQGKFYYQDGGMYDGNWSKNKMDGFGSLYYQSGKLAYQGMWKQDQFDGKGKLCNEHPRQLTHEFNYRNLDEIDDYWQYYQGNFVQDYKRGKGKLMLSNGQYFEGTFTNDVIEGPGIFYCQNGDMIKGMWNQNHLIST